MDHIRILQRSWRITWGYKALWVFGFLLALTSGGGARGGINYRTNRKDLQNMFPNGEFDWPSIRPDVWDTFNQYLPLIIGLSFLAILLALAFAFLRYISETSLIRMVHTNEEDGSKASVRQGFRLGWSRQAFHLWLIDLLVFAAGLVVTLIPILLVGVPLLVWLTDSTALRVIGTVVAVSLGLLLLFALILIGIAVSLVLQFARRACVIEKKGPIESIRTGLSMVRRRLGDTILMGLMLLGLGIVYFVLMLPVFLLLALAGGVLGGIPGLISYGITSLFSEGDLPGIIGGLVGVPIFLLVVGIPLAFIGGIFETFKSSAWTLTYRELARLEGMQRQPLQPIAPLQPAAPAPVESSEAVDSASLVPEELGTPDKPATPEELAAPDEPAAPEAPEAPVRTPGSMAGKKVAGELDEL